jgi:SET domain-containing protein
MKHKRFAFIRKNAKVVIPALILIIIIFSVINHNLEQDSEGLSNMTTIAELEKDTNINSVSNSLEYTIAQAQNLGRGERGLFAKKNYKKDDVIEVCPTLKMNASTVDKNNVLHTYFFTPNNKTNNDSLLALGYCGLINHSDTKKNCSWVVSKDDNNITMYATKDIASGEEFFTSYGENYWASNKANKVE